MGYEKRNPPSVKRKSVSRLCFAFTVTGKNYTHPISLGILSRILSSVAGVKYVGVDFRLNSGRIKFQPDLVALSQVEPLRPVLFLDYESPNSSDMRIPSKDVNAYRAWSQVYGRHIPYIIVTTLPNRKADCWKLRWTTKEQYNAKFRGREKDICQNPFRFWYDEYRVALRGEDLSQIHFLNIDGKKVKHVRL